MGATIVVDAFWGDSGKGKISAFIAKKLDAAYAVRVGTGTNAGHSVIINGETVKTNQLPCAFLHEKAQVRVGSGTAVDPEKLFEEVDRYNLKERTKIDFRCPIIIPEYKQAEADDQNLSEKVGSTKSGTGYTISQFVLRKAKQARDFPELNDYITDVAKELNEACEAGENIILEGSQGTYLSLALSPDYPYVTSDNCTTASAADDAGLSWQHIKDVILIVKAVPSRVGEGPLPNELSKEEIEKRGIAEYGVTTGRARRKAGQIDFDMLKYAAMLNGPTQIALTFCDHLDKKVEGARSKEELTKPVLDLIKKVEDATKTKVTLVETGKEFEDIVTL